MNHHLWRSQSSPHLQFTTPILRLPSSISVLISSIAQVQQVQINSINQSVSMQGPTSNKKNFPDLISFQNQESAIPDTHFLDKMFAKLEQTKTTKSSESKVPTGTHYKGFKTIPIQQLEPRKQYTDEPINGKTLWRSKGKIDYYQQNCHLSFEHQNGFMEAFYQAYIQHGDVQVTPDDVWLTIMFFFSKYVNDNSEKLRKAFVNHEGKVQLIVNTYSEGEKSWDDFLDNIVEQIKSKTVKGVTQELECNFSSTDKFSRFLSTAMVMNTFKKYFDYGLRICVCGIQNIHMGGCLQDWENLGKKLTFLRQFDVNGKLRRYVDGLLPVLDQFVQTYKGNPSLEFWNNIYHERKVPPQPYRPTTQITGWIIKFFTIYSPIGDKVEIEEIEVPIKRIDDKTQTTKMLHLLGGCKGVSVQDQKVYRPHFSFAIVDKTEREKHWLFE